MLPVSQTDAQLAQHVFDHFTSGFGSAAGRRVSEFFLQALDRRFRLYGTEGISQRVDRLEATISALGEAIGADGYDQETALEELKEPAARAFAADAIEDAVSTPNEGKRALVGRMIARRLSSPTESQYELLLRDTRPLISRLNETELGVLALLTIYGATPLPHLQDPSEWDQIEHLYMPVLETLRRLGWDSTSVERLVTLGLVERDEVGAKYEIAEKRGPVALLLERRWFRTEALPPNIAAFATLMEQAMHGGAAHQNFGRMLLDAPLTELFLTSRGAVIGALTIESHLKTPVRFPEWENQSASPLGLISPVNSQYLRTMNDVRRYLSNCADEERVKKLAPKAVAEDMARQSRSRGLHI